VLFVERSAADDRRIARPHVSKSSRQGVAIMPGSTHHQVLIVGGGTAGITVSAILKRARWVLTLPSSSRSMTITINRLSRWLAPASIRWPARAARKKA
jgi:hypothetical protein